MAQFIDKRLPESNVWETTNEIRWHFLFGGLFVPEMPIEDDEQPTYEQGEDGEPDPDSESQQEGQSQNIDEEGDAAGNGDFNEDLDDERNEGESDDDSDADTDSEPDHDSSDDDDGDESDDDFDDDEEDDEGDSGEDEIDPNEFGFDKPGVPDDLPGREVTANAKGGKDYTRTFESWVEFIQCASDLSLRQWKKGCCADTVEAPGGDYYATETMDEAVGMAMWRGWPEGRDMLVDSLAQVVPTTAFRITHELDVAGAYPIVPIYCGGDPACMVNIETETLHASRPIVRIDYNNMCSFLIGPEAMMKMGAAVLSFAQSLEIAGFSTELRIVGNSSVGKDNFRYNVTYKRAGEPIDLDRAAFAIAHPSTMRRFSLALMEQDAEIEHFGQNGHGYPNREPNDPTSGKPNGAIFIPPAARNYKEIEECTAIVENAAQDIIRQITKVQEAAD